MVKILKLIPIFVIILLSESSLQATEEKSGLDRFPFVFENKTLGTLDVSVDVTVTPLQTGTYYGIYEVKGRILVPIPTTANQETYVNCEFNVTLDRKDGDQYRSVGYTPCYFSEPKSDLAIDVSLVPSACRPHNVYVKIQNLPRFGKIQNIGSISIPVGETTCADSD